MRKTFFALLLVSLVLVGCTLNDAPATPEITEVVSAATESVQATCDTLIQTAITNVGTICDALDTNQACYGNRLVEVQFREGASEQFQQAGDIVPLGSLQNLRTAALDPAADQWGIALIRAQANLPGTLPGQAVTFMLFGDTELSSPNPEMRGITLRTGLGEVACEGAPPPALLVQSPDGTAVTLNINGADITIASTIHIRAVPQQRMTVATLQGRAEVTAFGETTVIAAGEQTWMPVSGTDLQVSAAPSDSEPFEIAIVEDALIGMVEAVEVTPVVSVTPPPTATTVSAQSAATTTGCVVRADWTTTYRVESGDTLSQIASRAGTTLAELQRGNCIDNPDQIAVGQALRVPRAVQPPPVTFTPQPTVAPSATPTLNPTATPTEDKPGDPNLRADRTTLPLGECALISWNSVSQTIYFEGQPATSTAREVCPQQTTTYTLLVIDSAGNQIPYRITIAVEQAAAECGNSICEQGEDARSCALDCDPPALQAPG